MRGGQDRGVGGRVASISPGIRLTPHPKLQIIMCVCSSVSPKSRSKEGGGEGGGYNFP